MSTTQRVVRKQLAGAEDLLQGVGTVTQTRGTGSYPIHKLDIPIPTYDIAEMQASSAEFMRLYGSDTAYTDYRRNPEGTIGIPSNLGGVWEPMRSSEYLVCGNFATGAYVFSSDCIVALDQQSYNWQGSVPKVVAAGSTPATSGGVGAGAWVDRTDATLRTELTSAAGAIVSLPQVATSYGISFSSLDVWSDGETLNIGDYRWHDNNVWTPNANATQCASAPSYTSFHTVRPDKLLTPENFGANPAIASQDAINRLFSYVTTNSIGLAYIDKQYLVAPSAHAGLAGTFGTNSVCLNLLSNLKVWGPGGFKLIDGASGASGAILGNWNGSVLSDCIIDVDIDGNKANTTGNISGVVFVDGRRCQFVNGRKIVDTTFNGLQFAKYSLACVADRPYISGCLYIGIQAQIPDGLQILFPRVYSVGDNAIDIEADGSSGDQTQIVGPTINGCSSGIFLESTGNVIVNGGTIEVCSNYAIILNQISTASTQNIITGVKMKRGSGVGDTAMYINNNSGYSSIYGCRFEGYSCSFSLNVAVGVHIGVNNHNGITDTLVKITRSSNALIRSFVEEQVLETERSSGKPFGCSPISNALNFGDRDYLCTIRPMRELHTNVVNAIPDDDYIVKTSTLSQNPAWSNSYAVYYGGETLIYIPTNTPTVGRYIYINNTLYYVYNSPSGGVLAIRSSDNVAGNFVASVNSNYSTKEYYVEYMTS